MQHRPDNADPDPTRLEDVGELCQRFERQWRQGERPRIEDFLTRTPPDAQPILLERLLRLEWALREGQKEALKVDPYLERFPAHQDRVRAIWRGWMERSTKPGDPTRLASCTQDDPLGITPPRTLGRYEDLELIGRGGMGVVFKGFDSRLKRLVAIKMINAAILSPEWLVRFRTEAEALARVQHPHIVQIYDWDEHDGQPYLVMEYVAGGSLEDRLRVGPLTPLDSARMVAILARAVQHAHASQVVHRDLKPANVLLAPALEGDPSTVAGGRPKVSDFGLARMTWESNAPAELPRETGEVARGAGSSGGRTATGMLLGTPAYVAPEQAAGRQRDVGPPADVWALGVILYRCLSGQLPFDADTQTTMLHAVQFADPAPFAKLKHRVPVDLEAACIRCLAKEPARRPIVRELAEMLEAFARAAPPGAVVPASGSGSRPIPRPPALKGAVLIEAGPEVSPPPVRSERTPQPAEESSELRRCPGCGKSVHVSWHRCHDCGTRLIRLKPPDFGGDDDRRQERRDAEPERRPEPEWEPDLRRPEEPERNNTGLILGVLALLCGLLSIVPGVSVAGVALGIIGWVISQDELSRLKKGPKDPVARRYTRIGLVCAICGTVTCFLATCVWVYVMLSG
jgi:serine/threonine protein kinase